jgi:hypothetical protein
MAVNGFERLVEVRPVERAGVGYEALTRRQA